MDDCQLYNDDKVFSKGLGIISPVKILALTLGLEPLLAVTTTETRIFLLYVLGSMLFVNSRRLKLRNQGEYTDCSVFQIGQTTSTRTGLTLSELVNFSQNHLLPNAFTDLLFLAVANTQRFLLAFLIVSTHLESPCYLCGLFQEDPAISTEALIPIKGVELNGLDLLFQTQTV